MIIACYVYPCHYYQKSSSMKNAQPVPKHQNNAKPSEPVALVTRKWGGASTLCYNWIPSCIADGLYRVRFRGFANLCFNLLSLLGVFWPLPGLLGTVRASRRSTPTLSSPKASMCFPKGHQTVSAKAEPLQNASVPQKPFRNALWPSFSRLSLTQACVTLLEHPVAAPWRSRAFLYTSGRASVQFLNLAKVQSESLQVPGSGGCLRLRPLRLEGFDLQSPSSSPRTPGPGSPSGLAPAKIPRARLRPFLGRRKGQCLRVEGWGMLGLPRCLAPSV